MGLFERFGRRLRMIIDCEQVMKAQNTIATKWIPSTSTKLAIATQESRKTTNGNEIPILEALNIRRNSRILEGTRNSGVEQKLD